MKIPSISNFVPFEDNINFHIIKILVFFRVYINADFYFLWTSSVNNTVCDHFVPMKNSYIIANLKFTMLWNLNSILFGVIIFSECDYYFVVKSLLRIDYNHISESCTFLFYFDCWLWWSHAIEIFLLRLLLLSE